MVGETGVQGLSVGGMGLMVSSSGVQILPTFHLLQQES